MGMWDKEQDEKKRREGIKEGRIGCRRKGSKWMGGMRNRMRRKGETEEKEERNEGGKELREMTNTR